MRRHTDLPLAMLSEPTLSRSAHATLALLAMVAVACSPAATDSQLGALSLGLTTEAGGVTYRLTHANFTLDGPEKREFSALDEDQIELELPAGAYRLQVLDGYALTRRDDPMGPPVAARLISQNPAPVSITAGQTARTTLRFELGDGAPVALGPGVLQVGIEIGAGDGGVGSASAACALGLRINEVDYEQANTDDTEFIELLNTGSCAAPLEGLQLELVNGSDGKVYGRYPLADAAPSLAAGARLVLGDPAVVAALPQGVASAQLNGAGLQNGPDGVRLVRGDTVIDALAYEDLVAGSSEGKPSAADDGELGLSRCPDGFDTGEGAVDVKLSAPSPGAANECT